jgi:hypothetical protein
LDQGERPINGATVWLVNATRELPPPPEMSLYFRSFEERNTFSKTITSPEGEFTFDDIAAGEWLVGIAPDLGGPNPAAGHHVSPNASHLTIWDGSGDVNIIHRVTRGHLIFGRVVKPDGAPAANTYVQTVAHRGGLVTSKTNGMGDFELGPLAEGQYSVRATGGFEFADSDPVTVDADAYNVELRLKAGGSIHGSVVNRQGEPCQAEIKLSAGSGRFDPTDMRYVRWTSTSPANEIDISGLEPGNYNVVAITKDRQIGVCKNVNVASGAKPTDVVVSVRLAGTLIVKMRESDIRLKYRVSVDGVMIDFGVADNSGDGGRTVVPPGKGTLTYWLESSAVKTREFEVAAGKEIEVVLDGKD